MDIEWYNALDIFQNTTENVETYFVNHLTHDKVGYSHVVTHFTSLCSSFHKKIKSRLPNSKLIVVDHNPRPLEGFGLKKQCKNRLKAWLYSRYIDQWVGVSQYTVDEIIKDLGFKAKRKTCCIYNGIDVDAIPEKVGITDFSFNENRPLRLMIVSHLRQSKGIQDALTALSLLSKKDLQAIKLDIYGEGPFEKELKQMTVQLKIKEQVTFKGSSSHIPELLKDYDYLLQPTYMECFSLSILESLAANLPVITTTVGGNTEVIVHQKNGFLFEARDIDELELILYGLLLQKFNIDQPTRPLIEQHFYLDKMVNEHFNLID